MDREKLELEIKILEQKKATIEAKILRKKSTLNTGIKSYSSNKSKPKQAKTSENERKQDENKVTIGFF